MKCEYRQNTTPHLDSMGKEGWELVCVVWHPERRELIYFWKRLIK